MKEVKEQTVRLPIDLAERLRLVAFRRRESQNTLIVKALTIALDLEEITKE